MSAAEMLDRALGQEDRADALRELFAATREWAETERALIEAENQFCHVNQKHGQLLQRRVKACARLLAAVDAVEAYQ